MDYRAIYRGHAAEYDELVGAEDCERNLLPAIERVHPLAVASVLEVGVGTGRIARLVVEKAARLIAIEPEPAMLEVARRHLERSSGAAWELHRADARNLPVGSGVADVAIAGWVFGHLRDWFRADWREQIGLALGEMTRVLKPGGSTIVIETLGTGTDRPAPPSAELAEYYGWLEVERGMRRDVFRTDYQFADVETAARVTGFFFGDEFAERVRAHGWTRVPECTGLWWRRKDAT